MARIALIEPDQAPPEVKEIYHQKFKGKPGNAQKAIAQRPDMLKNCLGFYASAGRSLDRKLYELIYIRVSMINQCHYCLQHHLASSKRTGVTPEDWKALQEAKALTTETRRSTEAFRRLRRNIVRLAGVSRLGCNVIRPTRITIVVPAPSPGPRSPQRLCRNLSSDDSRCRRASKTCLLVLRSTGRPCRAGSCA